MVINLLQIRRDEELLQDLKRTAGLIIFNLKKYKLYSYTKTSIYLDPKTVAIYDYQPFVDMVLPMYRADTKVSYASTIIKN